VAGAQFAEPVLFGRIVDVLSRQTVHGSAGGILGVAAAGGAGRRSACSP